MKRLLVTLIALVLCYGLKAQESVIWAHEVIDVSSEFGTLEYSAMQTLHQPNVYPQGGENPNAWRPKNDDKEDWVMVAFETPIRARQVAISETENPGAVRRVLAYDTDYNEYTLFEVTPRPIPIDRRLLNITFEETNYDIQAIRVELDGSVVPGFNAIDAIGISDSNIPINVLIELASGVADELAAEELGENVNSTYIEHSPIISPDGKRLYFSRKYHPDNAGGVDDPEDIWVSEWDDEKGEWLPAKNVGEPLNTPGPNFISSISMVDGKEQFILGNRYGKKGRMYSGVSISYLDNGKYLDPEGVDIENEYNYSNKADFFQVPGGEVMLLSVERDDSYGGRDLYVSFKKGKVWGEPKNMGGDVNTASEEAAPFLAADGKTLYFSTSGYSGYGGLDIYVSRRLDDSWEKWSPPDNLGSGINTEQDDQYFSIPSSGKHLYFTRGDTDSDTDIFRFKVDEFFIDPDDPIMASVTHLMEQEPIEVAASGEDEPVSQPTAPEQPVIVQVSGKVLNAKTNEPIPNVKVIVERLPDGIDIGEVTSLEDGSYKFALRPGARFGISASLDGFIAQNENLDLNETKEAQSIEMNLTLAPIEVGRPIVLNNIFFAFDKDALTTASYPELERVLEYLQSGRIQKIEIAGHTDSKGPDEYNLNLSKRRARSVYNYFLSNGIDRSRLESVGYGESKPVDTNDTDEGRKKNRRVEFKVLETG
jgi:outer membrane protein OmpA-like peptidoglycan-associated protein